MEDALSKLGTVFNHIEDIEKQHTEDESASQIWVNEITDPQFQLLSNFINLLHDPLTSSQDKSRIIHILRMFLYISKDGNVHEQLIGCKKLPEYLSSNLITSGNEQEIFKDSISIIANIFKTEDFSPVITVEFINCLFQGLPLVDDQETLSLIIGIFVEINSIFTSIDSNIFLTVYSEHENSRMIEEMLLKMLNIENDKQKMYKMFLCLANMMDKLQKNIFYSGDLQTFVDIAIGKLESTYTDELKLFTIDVLQRVTLYDEYYKEMYKISELTDLMEDYAANEEHSQAIKDKSQIVLDNLVKHLEAKLKDVNPEDEIEVEDDPEEEEEEEKEKDDDDEDDDN